MFKRMLIQPFDKKMTGSGRIYRDVTVSNSTFDIKILGESDTGVDDGYIIGTCNLSKNCGLISPKPPGIYVDNYKINDEYQIIFDDIVNIRIKSDMFEPIFRLASIGSDVNGGR